MGTLTTVNGNIKGTFDVYIGHCKQNGGSSERHYKKQRLGLNYKKWRQFIFLSVFNVWKKTKAICLKVPWPRIYK